MSAPKVLNAIVNIECGCGWIEEVDVDREDLSLSEICWPCGGCGRWQGVYLDAFTQYYPTEVSR